jgi:hypothetical protein
MSTPLALQGAVIEPGHVSAPHSYAAHDFFTLIKDLVHLSGFHSESQVLAAMNVVDGYEKHVTGADARYVASESDRGPVEDVTLRVPPMAGVMPLAPAQQIDYARLAAAIVAATAAQAAAQSAALPPGSDTHAQPVPPGGVPVITDAAPSSAFTAPPGT